MIHGYATPYDFDMALTGPVFYMMQRGIRIDGDVRDEFHRDAHAKWEVFQTQLNSVAGHTLNANSPKQVKDFLYKELGLPVRRSGGAITADETALRSLMALCNDKIKTLQQEKARFRWKRGYVGILLLLKIRGVRKQISSYIDVNIDDDFRMRTTLSIGGARTFRFSASKTLWDTGCNLQTIPRSLRRMFVADEGKEMAELDLNRGESWIYSHLANEPEMIRIHATGGDFHTETACAISTVFGHFISVDAWGEFEERDSDGAYKLRYLGKKTNHASAYRMGPFRFAEVVNNEADDTGITITIAQAREAQRLWRARYPFIEQWWMDIEDRLNKDSRTLTTPYGRKRTFFGRWGEQLFKEATAHVPQSTSVDYINGGMLRAYDKLVKSGWHGMELLHQNHDSILIQYDEGRRDEVLPEVIGLLQSDLLIGSHSIQIPVEAEYGQNWGELIRYAPAA
jgi:DNA polymerase-1